MSRQVNQYEKKLFEIVKEYDNRFYYESIFKVVNEDEYELKIEKDKEEMVGYAYVTFPDGKKMDYEIRYNRIANLNSGYTLLVTGSNAG